MKIHVIINEVRIEDEVFLEREEMVSFQTKGRRNFKMNEKNF
jgi:hypothetical protein